MKKQPKTIGMVRKRDGRLEEFKTEKIAQGIAKSMREALGKANNTRARAIADRVATYLEDTFGKKIPSTEDIHNTVEQVLFEQKLPKVAKAFLLYRTKRKTPRNGKRFFGVKDDLSLGINTIKVLERRYLKKDAKGYIIETPSQMFWRVAQSVAQVEQQYGAAIDDLEEITEKFYQIMADGEFLPNSPTLMNAGLPRGQLAACFVLPIKDELASIFDTLKATAMIHQTGGGTGFNFSAIRPRGDIIRSTGGEASGPISFMKLFDQTTEVIKQGGRRRGANMALMDISHPDIEEFITLKSTPDVMKNFNISVSATDGFMRAVQGNRSISVINPRTGKRVGKVRAKKLFDLIVKNAWGHGDPGLVFMDEINRKNPTAHSGRIDATNPCGEQPLHPNESCTLGSINLAKLVSNGEMNWKRLRELVQLSVRFLDDVVDANEYPIQEIREVSKSHRRIGLGVMGFAEALIRLGMPYDSQKALKFADELMSFIKKEGHKASAKLGRERGSFPAFRGSTWQKRGRRSMRNATVTTIAPTGTISIIAGCSSGIEPLFAVSYVRNVMEGTQLLEVNSLFEEIAKKRGFYSSELIFSIAQKGRLPGIKGIPSDVRALFKTATEIKPEWHVKMQAVFQKHVDNAVSKTVNLPEDAKVADVRKTFMLAWKMKCKGITVYRYGTKKGQVLTVGPLPIPKTDAQRKDIKKHMQVTSEFSGGCPNPPCHY